MKKYYNNGYVSDLMVSQFTVQAMIDKEGACGLGLFTATCLYLKKCYHAIGTFDDIKHIARSMNKNANKVRQWLMDYGIFQVDTENELFTYPSYRKMFKLESKITEREIDVIHLYGNKIKMEPEEYTELHPIDKSVSNQKVKKSLNDNCAEIEQTLNNNSTEIKNSNAQVSDNVENKVSPTIDMNKSHSICIICKDNNTNKNITSSSSIDDSGGDDAEKSFKFFEEKIFNNNKWRKAISNSSCISLNDDKVMHVFARWMYDYCISKNKIDELKNENDILLYAANLLTKGLRTRKMFDEYLAKTLGIAAPSNNKKHAESHMIHDTPLRPACYEQLIKGQRIGLGGEVIPQGAPRLYNINNRWSTIENKYVDKSVWNKEKELAAYKELKRKEQIAREAEIRAIHERFNREHPEVLSKEGYQIKL